MKIIYFFFLRWNDPQETQQYFPTFVDGRGGKPPTILAEGLTPEDSRLKPVTCPQTCTHVLPIELTLGAIVTTELWMPYTHAS